MTDDTEDPDQPDTASTGDKPDTKPDLANTADKPDNVISFAFRAASKDSDGALDDDDLLHCAGEKIAEWKAAGIPSLAEVQKLFHDSICTGASSMARDKIIAAIITAFGSELGGKRAMIGTWVQIARDHADECAQEARENTAQPELTPAEKAALREALWPTVCDLAQSPDLMNRVVRQVQTMGVVNEDELITLTYIAATSRVLEHPINILTKGASSGGKSFTISHVLELVGPDFVNKLTSSSALSLVYDTSSLAHTVIFLFEANQLQTEKTDKDSTFAMLVRTLISEGRIVHQTTVEDPSSPTGRRVERIVREGPIALITTTTGELYSENETRMLSWHIHEDREQTAAVMTGIAKRAIGAVGASIDLARWHDFQRWIALGPNDAVIPFAQQITDAIKPLMVRFRRDVGSLFSFIKASALLHQAQRQKDAQGRVVATVADYAIAHPIFSKVMAESSGKAVTENVRVVVKLIAERAAAAPTKHTGTMRFQRVEVAGRASEVTISSEQIGIATGLGRLGAYRAVINAIDLGFLTNNETRPRKPFRLVLQHKLDEAGASLLPDPTTIVAVEGGAA